MTRSEARRRRIGTVLLCAAVAAAAAGCEGNFAGDGEPSVDPRAGPLRENRGRATEGKLFDDDLSVSSLRDGTLLGGEGQAGDAMPVNKYLWRASLDTLSFLPLASTDPFTGVIASDWSSSPETPRERFKVTVYLLRPVLEASSLKVAVFRQALSQDNIWVAQAVSPETAAQLETAILTRARQMRIAEIEGEDAG